MGIHRILRVFTCVYQQTMGFYQLRITTTSQFASFEVQLSKTLEEEVEFGPLTHGSARVSGGDENMLPGWLSG